MSVADAERRFIMTDGASALSGDRCPNGLFGSHRFEARYDLSPPDLSQFSEIMRMSVGFAEKLRRKTYVRDVCTKCGKTIERNHEQSVSGR